MLVCNDKLSAQNFNYDVTFYFLPAIVVKRTPKNAIVLKYYSDIDLWKIELCEYDRSSFETKLTRESLEKKVGCTFVVMK